MSLQQMCFGIAGTCVLVNLAFKLKWEGKKMEVAWNFFRGGQENNEKKIEKDCLFGYSLKIGFRPIWPCVFGGRQSNGSQEGR